jgi:ribosome-binding ATPase YchF (GTP1/OBG family)
MSFLTAGEKEARAWTIPQGSRAQDAAGAIHSDIARGFIRAEIVSYDDLIKAGTYAVAREQGCCAWKARTTSCRKATS